MPSDTGQAAGEEVTGLGEISSHDDWGDVIWLQHGKHPLRCHRHFQSHKPCYTVTSIVRKNSDAWIALHIDVQSFDSSGMRASIAGPDCALPCSLSPVTMLHPHKSPKNTFTLGQTALRDHLRAGRHSCCHRSRRSGTPQLVRASGDQPEAGTQWYDSECLAIGFSYSASLTYLWACSSADVRRPSIRSVGRARRCRL